MNPASSSVLKRALLILAASAAIIAFAVVQGKAIIGGSTSAYHVRSGRAVLEPIEGSTFLRSYPVIYNGRKTQFAHYTSRLKADEVIKEYMRKHGADGASDFSHAPKRPSARAPMLSSTGSGCSALSYVTESGTVIGVVAFDAPDADGCAYFVGSMPAGAARDNRSGDCPGREPPGVPKPPRSTRSLCIENLGGLPSVLTFYEAWGRPSEIVEDLRHGMAEHQWKERRESSAILTQNYAGHALLSFSRGHEQCVVGVDQERKTGKIVVVVFWAERPWLPEGTAL